MYTKAIIEEAKLINQLIREANQAAAEIIV
jgi:hypothetical protein